MKEVFSSPIGIGVFKGDWEGAEWTVTGFPSREICAMFEFDSAYDFEEYIQKHIKHDSITFDTEFSQFYAYAPTKQKAISFAKAIEKHFVKTKDKIKKLTAK